MRGEGSGHQVDGAPVVEHPGVLGPAALRGVDDHRTGPERDPGQPAGDDSDLVAEDGEGPQIDVPRGEAAVDRLGGHGREVDQLLSDPALGLGLDPARLCLAVGGAGVGADEHALAAGLGGRLDHELVDPREDVAARRVVLEQVGGNVVEDRLLAQVEADHLGNVVIDRLVVGDPGPDRVGDRHRPRPIGADEAGNAEQRVRAELERIDVVIVEAAVDRMHALQAGGGAHVADGVAHDQVGRLDELDAHLTRDERVLEVGAVRRARGPHDHGGIGVGGRRHGPQGVEQEPGVVVDRPYPVSGEQLGHESCHGDAVLEHVGDARGRADIVFEHSPAAVAAADEVATGNVAVDAARRTHAVDGPGEARPAHDQRPRDDARPDDLVRVVDVVDERVQGADPLRQSALDRRPLLGGEDAGHQIEGEGTVATLAVGPGNLEGDPLLHEDPVPPPPGGGERLGAEALERGDQRPGVESGLTALVDELVATARRELVVVEQALLSSFCHPPKGLAR